MSQKIIALYEHLSHDDKLQGESNSISNQRMMLRQYAAEHCLTVVDEYVDDGWSGTNYDRPGFQRMIDDIEDESELAPFLNILNEMHARQTSKKVKAAMRTRFANGAHYGAYEPLNYIKDQDKKGHLLVDPETRWIIEKIFDLAVHGAGATKITRILVAEKVPTAGWLNFQRYGTQATP